MLAAEAMRLAAVEALRPTPSIAGNGPWPTLAGALVFDSRAVAIDDLGLSGSRKFTPVLSVYTEGVRVERMGDIAPSHYGVATVDLVIEAELAVRDSDDDGPFVDAAQTDPEGKLMLGALCAQVRKRLVFDPQGIDFRSGLVAAVHSFRIEPASMPQLGLRYLRSTMTFTLQIADDEYGDDAGLPEPIARLLQRLPANSYSRDRLAALAAAFAPIARDQLDDIIIRESEGGDPVASA